MSKIIFLDMDGTIRDFDGTIPSSAKEAIKKARANGHQVCISSGRPYYQIMQELSDMEFDGIISGTGSYVMYKEECLRHKFITQFTYLSLCDYLLQHKCVFRLMTHKAVYVLRQTLPLYQQVEQNIQKNLGENARKLMATPPTVIDSLLDVHEIEKIVFFSDTISLEDLKSKWDTCFYIVPSSIPYSGKTAGEITPSVVNKAAGILSIMEAGGFEREDVVAIGDSDNDIDMIQFAGCGIAMGNATDSVKNVADYITLPLNEDGLYHAFVREKLI